MIRHRCPECGRPVGLHGNGLSPHYVPDSTDVCVGTGTQVNSPPDLVAQLVQERFGAPRLPPAPPIRPTYVLMLMPPEPWMPPAETPVDIGPDVQRLCGLRWSVRQIAAVLETTETAVERALGRIAA